MPDRTPSDAEVLASMTPQERALFEFSMRLRQAAAALAKPQGDKDA